MGAPAVSIIILNWNGVPYLRKFLPSVLATHYENFHVFVADNGSTDGSIAMLQKEFPSVRIIDLKENHGFAQGNNLAVQQISTPYYVLLNSDVETDPGWLAPLVRTMEEHPDAAAAQPKLLDYNRRNHFEYAGAAGGWMDKLGYPFCRGRLFGVCEEDKGQYDTPSDIFWASGACMIIRKSVSDRIGLFEPRFFAHQEEIDFCWRARNFGYRILYTPEGKVWHVGGGTLKKENPRKTFLNVRNSLASTFMNFPASQIWWKFPARLVLDGIWGIRALAAFQFQSIPAIIKGHFAFYFSFGYWLQRRRERYANLKEWQGQGPGYYKGGIVWQHFIRRKKHFSELDINA